MSGFSSAKYFSPVFPSSLMSAACSDSGGLGHFFGLNTNPPHSRAQTTAKAEGSDLKWIQKPQCKQGGRSWGPPRWRISKFPPQPANTPQSAERPPPQRPLCPVPIRCHPPSQSQERHLQPLPLTHHHLFPSRTHRTNSAHQKNTTGQPAETSPSPAGPAAFPSPWAGQVLQEVPSAADRTVHHRERSTERGKYPEED